MNKLGISEYKLRDVEKQIINLKLNILDYYFTFNNEKFDFKFLKKLHEFLFSDFYYSNESGTRNLSNKEEQIIESYLFSINNLCINDSDNIKDILYYVEEIWNLQPFIVGNTRTLIAFIKLINEAFTLNLHVDVNKEILSNPVIFRLDNFVNQKRLTK